MITILQEDHRKNYKSFGLTQQDKKERLNGTWQHLGKVIKIRNKSKIGKNMSELKIFELE